MFSLTLCAVSMLGAINVPSFTGALDSPQPRFPSIRLVDDVQPPAPYQQMSLADLQLEHDRLLESRPSIGLGIGLLIGGVVALNVAVVLVYIGFLAGILGAGVTGFLIVGVVVALAGVAGLVFGGISLGTALRERRAISQSLNEVNARIKSFNPNAIPPPPPAPGTVVPQVSAPVPGLLLAEF